MIGDLARIESHNTGAMVSNSHRSSRARNKIITIIINQHTPVKSWSLAMKLRTYLRSISETNLHR